jgi:very-short-patch-repair endonuclease
VEVRQERYYLDFAIFCNVGSVDIETDGDTWHADPKRIPQDNRRNNDVESAGWHVLRFNGQEIREGMATYCVPKITKMINRLGGLEEETLAPRRFYELSDDIVQQLALFEQEPDDLLDD